MERNLEILKPCVQLHIVGRKSTKFHMNLMKDVGRVGETRFWMDKVYDNMGNNSGQKQSNQNHMHIFISSEESLQNFR